METLSKLMVKPCAAAQTEKGEQLLQSFNGDDFELFSECPSAWQLSKMEQGTTALNKI